MYVANILPETEVRGSLQIPRAKGEGYNLSNCKFLMIEGMIHHLTTAHALFLLTGKSLGQNTSPRVLLCEHKTLFMYTPQFELLE